MHNEAEYPYTPLQNMRNHLEFIKLVEDAMLETQFSPEELAELRDPQEHESTPPDNPALRFSLLNYLSFINSSQETYEEARQNLSQCYPGIELLSHYRIKRQARLLSGIITWEHHMCVGSCISFTGPFADMESCLDCGEPRYEEKDLEEFDGERKVPQKVFTTFPVGPQLQVRWKNPQTAKDMLYQQEKTDELR